MKNLIKVFGIIALVAIIGFSFAACDDGSEGGSVGGSGSGYSASRGGTFILTDIPAQYNGMYAKFQSSYSASPWVRGSEKAGTSGIDQNPLLISNRMISIPLWKDTLTQTGFTGYTGNDTLNCSVNIHSRKSYDSNTVILYASTFSVTFSNGNATRSWNDLTWNNR
jgi:hypothetical protein